MKLTRSLLKKIAVGVSGGVDSAVAAWALKIQGHDIHGVFMRNWDSLNESDSGNCTEDTECAVAAWVCRSLDIPFTEMNFVSHYWNDVFQYTLSEYTAGLTPNPDILCNRHIKFGQLAETCRERLGCDWLATGHYARVVSDKSQGTRLLKARDESKDQTFFLSAVPQSALARAIFPLGGLLKSEVREIAEAVGLTKVAHKKDSTGICFIGKRNFQKFISQYVEDRPGRMVDIDTGVVVGDHQGRHHWTLGQRCHLEAITKYYVANKLQDSNDILVCAGYHHPSLYSTSFVTDPPHWIRGIPPPQLTSQGKVLCEFRFQRGAPLVPCVVSCAEPGSCGVGLSIALKEPLRVITPGQFAVFYDGEECLGCAKIIRPGPSLYELNTSHCKDVILGLRRHLPSLVCRSLGKIRRRAKDTDGAAAVALIDDARDAFCNLVEKIPYDSDVDKSSFRK